MMTVPQINTLITVKREEQDRFASQMKKDLHFPAQELT